jgi:hypothetical protein
MPGAVSLIGANLWLVLGSTKRKPGWLARLLQRRVEMWLHHSAARADAGFARRVSQELLSNIGEYEGNIAWISATQWPGQHLAIT